MACGKAFVIKLQPRTRQAFGVRGGINTFPLFNDSDNLHRINNHARVI